MPQKASQETTCWDKLEAMGLWFPALLLFSCVLSRLFQADRIRRMKGIPEKREEVRHISADDLGDSFTPKTDERKMLSYQDGKIADTDGELIMQGVTLSSHEWSMSNFPCSLASNITSHSMQSLAFQSLLRWKMIVLPNSPCITYTFLHKRLGECTFWAWEWKG